MLPGNRVLRVAAVLAPTSLALFALQRALRVLLAAGLLEVPLSEFLTDLQNGRLAEANFAGNDTLEAILKPLDGGAAARAGAVTKRAYKARLIPFIDRAHLVELLSKHGVVFGAKAPHWSRNVLPALLGIFPIVYFVFLGRLLLRMQQDPTTKIDGVGKRADTGRGARPLVHFADVEGVDEAKAELAEIVDFLRHPGRYQEIGARLPKGVLLSGPPGTGKTLLARAVATEAGVPFLSCSASDFVEMLVGRGAARVRDLFQRGTAAAPCIIFIDELDALAKARGGLNSNDEREQTLMQLLTELDGFDGSSNVLVIAATNRPQVLDPALRRPGRFDRHVKLGLPDVAGRQAILQVHCRSIRLGTDVRLDHVAQQTDGFSGAELANVVNEAALLAVRGAQRTVSAHHVQSAFDRAVRYRAPYPLDYQTTLEMMG